MSNNYTFIEVCSGAGGLSKGFIDNGFHPLLLNDTDKYCVETLKLNHPETKIFKGSMLDINLDEYKNTNVDVLLKYSKINSRHFNLRLSNFSSSSWM